MSLSIPKKVPKSGFYYHYKHDPKGPINNYAYEVIGIGFHTENEEHFLIYRPLYENESSVYSLSKELNIPCFYNRPLKMWMEDVEKDGKKISRFKRITDPEIIAELKKIRDQMYQ